MIPIYRLLYASAFLKGSVNVHVSRTFWGCSERVRYVLYIFGVFGKDIYNGRKCFPPMYHRMVSACFPFTFQMFSVYFQNRHYTSRTLTSSFVCFPNALRTWRIDRMHQKLDGCFQNVFRTYRTLLECSPNTFQIQMDATFGRSMKNILNMHYRFLELPNAETNSQYDPRTCRMLSARFPCPLRIQMKIITDKQGSQRLKFTFRIHKSYRLAS